MNERLPLSQSNGFRTEFCFSCHFSNFFPVDENCTLRCEESVRWRKRRFQSLRWICYNYEENFSRGYLWSGDFKFFFFLERRKMFEKQLFNSFSYFIIRYPLNLRQFLLIVFPHVPSATNFARFFRKNLFLARLICRINLHDSISRCRSSLSCVYTVRRIYLHTFLEKGKRNPRGRRRFSQRRVIIVYTLDIARVTCTFTRMWAVQTQTMVKINRQFAKCMYNHTKRVSESSLLVFSSVETIIIPLFVLTWYKHLSTRCYLQFFL